MCPTDDLDNTGAVPGYGNGVVRYDRVNQWLEVNNSPLLINTAIAMAIAALGGTYLVQGLVDDGNALSFTGTDNAAVLQSEINKAVYTLGLAKVQLPAGVFCIGDTVHLGYGVNAYPNGSPYVTIVLEGASGTGINTGAGGTNFLWIGPKDRPAFAISGNHQTRIRKLSVRGGSSYVATGPAADYIFNQGLEASWNVPNSHLLATWVDPSISVAGTGNGTSGGFNGVAGSGNGASITAPWCAFAVDPYVSAVIPTPAYPNVVFPPASANILNTAFANNPTQYNKAASTDTQFEDVHIAGFLAGIVVAPTGATGQSDFCRYTRVWINNCVYGISVNGSNPRENSLTDSYINQCYYGISTGLHCTAGNGSAGQWGAAVVNTAFDRNIKWFHFNQVGAQYTGNVTFLNCYGENVYQIGSYGRAGTGSNPDDGNLIMQSCMVEFNNQGIRGVPARHIEASDPACVTILGGSYNQYVGAFSLECIASQLSITGGARFKKYGTPSLIYEKIADNGSGGGVVCRATGNSSFGEYNSKYMGYDTAGTFTERWTQNAQSTSATKLGCWYAARFFGNKMGSQAPNPRAGSSIAMTASLNTISLVDRVLTWTWNSGRSTQQLALNGYGVGDVMQEQATGYVFYIFASGNTLKAVQMTGWSLTASQVNSGGSNGQATAFKMDANYFPSQVVTVTFTSATAFTVAGATQGAMGSGTVGTAFAGTGGLGFTVNAGTVPFAAGHTLAITIGYQAVNGWSPDSSYIVNTMNCRMFTPANYVAATATSGSNSLTAAADDSGSNTNVAAALPPGVGINLYADTEFDNMFTNCGPITANAAGTITLTGNATKSGTRQLDLAARVFANVATPIG